MLLEFFIIFAFFYAGNLTSVFFNIPIPGTVMGMLFLFFSLRLKLLKLNSIERAANILILNMTLLFIPPGVSLIKSLKLLEGNWIKITFIMVVTTIVTIVTTGLFIQHLMGRLKNGKFGK
jgi:holin-like protein